MISALIRRHGCRSRLESIFGFAAALLMRRATKQLPCDYIMHTHYCFHSAGSIRQNWIPWFNQIWRGANYALTQKTLLLGIKFISHGRPSIHHFSPRRDLMNSRPCFQRKYFPHSFGHHIMIIAAYRSTRKIRSCLAVGRRRVWI